MRLKSSVVLTMLALATMCSSAVLAEEAYEFDLSTISRELGVDLSAEDFQRLKDESILGRHQYDVYINTQTLVTIRLKLCDRN